MPLVVSAPIYMHRTCKVYGKRGQKGGKLGKNKNRALTLDVNTL